MLAIIVACVVVGLFLATTEVLLPGTIWGVVGAAFLILAVVLGYQEGGAFEGGMVFAAVIASLFLVLGLSYLLFPKMAWAKKYFTEAAKYGRSVLVHDGKPIMGKLGVVYKCLKPGGLIAIDGIRYKAFSQDGVLENGTQVIVIGHSLARLLVKKATA